MTKDTTKLWDRARDKSDQRCIIEDRLLWRKPSDQLGNEVTHLCDGRKYRSLELAMARCPGHIGRDRTVQHILDKLFWLRVHAKVRLLFKACLECRQISRRCSTTSTSSPMSNTSDLQIILLSGNGFDWTSAHHSKW